jgi:hypothetical protein
MTLKGKVNIIIQDSAGQREVSYEVRVTKGKLPVPEH